MNTSRARYLIPTAALVTMATLSGCTWFGTPTIQQNQATEPTPTSGTTTPGTGSFDINDGQGNFSITSDEGNTDVQLGGKLPADWPIDLPTPNNGQLVFAGSQKEGDKTTFTASFAVIDQLENVVADLKAAYERAGWTISDASSVNLGVSFAGFSGKKGDSEVDVTVLSGEGTATQTEGVSVTISGEYK